MPIIGARIAAAVIACPGSPIMGEILIAPKTTYNAVKLTVTASCRGSGFRWNDMCRNPSKLCGKLIIVDGL
jgi:hypothetical protein